jgi:tRNA(fMet)-specific endonuclease VapC
MNYLLDTNICIYIIKQKPPQVLERLQKLTVNQIGISVITLAELEYGVAKSSFPERNKMALIQFLAPFEVLQFSQNAAAIYGRIRFDLEKKGQIIGSYDLLIGAQALSEKLTLVTNSEREFRRIPGISIENWVIL